MVPGGIPVTTQGTTLVGTTVSPTWVTPWGESLGDLTNLPDGDRIFITDIVIIFGAVTGNYFFLFDDINDDGTADANEILAVIAPHTRLLLQHRIFSQPLVVRFGLRTFGFGTTPGNFAINAIWVPK